MGSYVLTNDDLAVQILGVPCEGDLFSAYVRLREALPGKKTYWDRGEAYAKMRAHVAKWTPEILDASIRVLDIGPGAGMFLEIARACRCEILGIEAPPTTRAPKAYERVTDLLELPIDRRGLKEWIGEALHVEPFDLIHARGSLDAALKGPGHVETAINTERFVLWASKALKPGGRLVAIHNDGPTSWTIMETMETCGMLEFEQPNRLVTILRRG